MRLEGRGLGFRYERDRWLFRGLDIAIEAGEVVGLLGPSGCGKTTLGRLLAGYRQPEEGEILYNDRPIPSIGYYPVQLVSQHPERAVNPRWRMRRVLAEGGTPEPALLSALGIRDDWLSRTPAELSGGELQRICIARALGGPVRFVIADEMTTMLDAVTQAQIWHAVLDAAQAWGIGVLAISHDERLIRRICGRWISWN